MIKLFGKKPPKNERLQPRQQNVSTERVVRRNDLEENRKDREDNRPAPPSLDERLDKLNKRLNLSDDQMQKIKSLMTTSKQKENVLRKKVNPDPDEIENEKRMIRRNEDESILKLLNEEQKQEFNRMIINRRK